MKLVYYGLVRIALCAGGAWLYNRTFKKYFPSRKGRKIFRLTLMFMLPVIYQAIYFFPFENYICTFSAPEEIFRYTATGEILGVVEGKESCMIVYQRPDNAYSTLFVKKENESYKIIEPQPLFTPILVSMGEYKTWGELNHLLDGTDVYFMTSWSTQEDEAKVEDNAGSTFHYAIIQTQLSNYNYKIIFAYAYVEHYHENYEVTIG